MLNTTMNVQDGELTVILEGRLDAFSSQSLEKELEESLDGVTAITFDCAKVEYISSAGLRTLLAAEQYMEDNEYEDVKVINSNELLIKIFEETGFTDLLNIVR